MKLGATLLVVFFGINFWQSVSGQEELKNTVAVLDFEGIGIAKTEASILTQRFRSELVTTNAFRIIERSQMESILEEVGFQQTGCTSSECMVEVGQILNVHRMIGGTIGKLGEVYTLDLRMIDVASSQILESFSEDHRGKLGDLLPVIKQIAKRFALWKMRKEKLKTPVPKVGSLEIFSTPKEATVFINGEIVGESPYGINNLEVGEYQIRLEKEKYVDFEKTITVSENQVSRIDAAMIAILELEINTDPVGAILFINDREISKTPFSGKLRAGTYTLKVVKENHIDWKKTIKLVEDEEIDINLEPTPEYLAKAGIEEGSNLWLWIGGGAVIVGGAALLLVGGSGDSEPATPADDLPQPPNPPQ
jgi:hypothetical protein